MNPEKGVFKCWICDYSGTKISPLIRRYAPSYYADWRLLEGEVDLSKYDTIFAEDVTPPPQVIDMPEHFQTLTGKKTSIKKKALKYMYSRGFTDLDILRWKVGFCNYGEYKDVMNGNSIRQEFNEWIVVKDDELDVLSMEYLDDF